MVDKYLAALPSRKTVNGGATLVSERKIATDEQMGQKFIDTLFARDRHKALYGGRGCAKSWSVATYLPIRAAKSKKRIVCARQFQNSIRDSSKELIEKRIHALGMSNQFTITDRYIVHNGTQSQFMFVGLERNIESIRSLEGADIVWIEEAKTISAKSMEILLPTVRAAGSELIWTWNPDKPTDPVDAYFRHGKPPPRIASSPKSPTATTRSSTPPRCRSEMEVLKDGNFARYKHVWEGEYDVSLRIQGLHQRPRRPAGRPGQYAAATTAWTSASATIPLSSSRSSPSPNASRSLHRRRSLRPRHRWTSCRHMVRGVTRQDGDLVKCDSSQPGTIEFLQSRGINAMPAKKGPGSVKSGITLAARLSRSSSIPTARRCRKKRDSTAG